MTKTVELHTSAGVIRVELDDAKAPASVENFLAYAKAGHYDGTVFHRVIDGFMIQGGGMDARLREKPTKAPIKLEAGNGLSNVRGTLAMARTSNPDSANSQFFIMFAPIPSLDGQYTIWGEVTAGMEAVDKIKRGSGGSGMVQGPDRIRSMKVAADNA
jgi:cyclophilin family peptidyl-prolyl cis-trans isomerase